MYLKEFVLYIYIYERTVAVRIADGLEFRRSVSQNVYIWYQTIRIRIQLECVNRRGFESSYLCEKIMLEAIWILLSFSIQIIIVASQDDIQIWEKVVNERNNFLSIDPKYKGLVIREFEKCTTGFGADKRFADDWNWTSAIKKLDEFVIEHGTSVWHKNIIRAASNHFFADQSKKLERPLEELMVPIQANLQQQDYPYEQNWTAFIEAINEGKEIATQMIRKHQKRWMATNCVDNNNSETCYKEGLKVHDYYNNWLKYRHYDLFVEYIDELKEEHEWTTMRKLFTDSQREINEHFDKSVKKHLLKEAPAGFGWSTIYSVFSLLSVSTPIDRRITPSNLKPTIGENDATAFVHEMNVNIRLVALRHDFVMQKTLRGYKPFKHAPLGVFVFLPDDYKPVDEQIINDIRSGGQNDVLKGIVDSWAEQFDKAYEMTKEFAAQCGRNCDVPSTDYLDEVNLAKAEVEKLSNAESDGSSPNLNLIANILANGANLMQKAQQHNFYNVHAGIYINV